MSRFLDSIIPPPIISIEPLNQTVLEGKDFNVTCIAKGNPKPEVRWKSASNDAIITNVTEDIVLLNNGFKHTLILKGVRKSDSGSYRLDLYSLILSFAFHSLNAFCYNGRSDML